MVFVEFSCFPDFLPSVTMVPAGFPSLFMMSWVPLFHPLKTPRGWRGILDILLKQEESFLTMTEMKRMAAEQCLPAWQLMPMSLEEPGTPMLKRDMFWGLRLGWFYVAYIPYIPYIPYISYIHTYHTIPYHTIPYHTIPYHTIPYHTTPHHTTPYHTIPYHTYIHTYMHTYVCVCVHIRNQNK